MLKGLKGPENSPISRGLRSRRWERLAARFPDLSSMTVVDLGGTVRSWDLAKLKPARLVIVNMPEGNAEDIEGVVLGDACDPELLAGEKFDLVYSNSVIEHVGGHRQRERFAETVHRLGTHHWVQTPYRYFPVEPHFLVPGLQYLPYKAQAEVISRWPVGNYANLNDRDVALQRAMDIELLSRAELGAYFPDSEILVERFGPLVKSLVAVL